ncbi:hypothetical protein HOY82DRAFT_537217 [Tuber indicum]|nr:hypothetical protein HOY82DRAFT_537217 [Tuber indicum]
MTITTYLTAFLLAAFLLLHTSTVTLAAPTDITDSTIQVPEIGAMSTYYTELIKSIPVLLAAKNAADLETNRKTMEDAMKAFNQTYGHLLIPGENDKVTPSGHRICETTSGSPRWSDALAASHRVLNHGERCIMDRQCNTFGTFGEASVGACAGGPKLWDHDCRVMWAWLIGICNTCVRNIDGIDRTGGRYLFDHPSESDVRVYHS